MKAIYYKSMSFFLALLVLGSTTSFSIAKHYCGDHLVDVAFFGETQPCKMEIALIAKYGQDHTKKVDCCSDEETLVQGQDELKIQFEEVAFDNTVFLQTPAQSYIFLFDKGEERFVPFDGYPPPLIAKDFQLLYEQFLI